MGVFVALETDKAVDLFAGRVTRAGHGMAVLNRSEQLHSMKPGRNRVASVDALRGIVMIVMALDHVRDFFHVGAMSFQPDDLTRTTAAIFLTRWITHFCAPVFMFTAGLGSYFWLSRGHTKAELSRFLWKRGLWLILLELIVIRFVMFFSLTSGIVILEVIWVLGLSMMVLGFLIHMPVRILGALSLAVIVLHNLADKVTAAQFGVLGWVWNVLHQQGVFSVAGVPVLVAYPLVPWVFVMAVGFCFGEVMLLDARERRSWMIRIGLACIAAFIVIRALNIYGDPQPWSTKVPGMAVLSFLRTSKYPPSLDFLLMTLGPALLLLRAVDRGTPRWLQPALVFGRVPMFYYVVHFTLIHLLAVLVCAIRYREVHWMFESPDLAHYPFSPPPGWGFPLPIVYAVWLAVVAMIYPVCAWFAGVRQRRRDPWLSYL